MYYKSVINFKLVRTLGTPSVITKRVDMMDMKELMDVIKQKNSCIKVTKCDVINMTV